MKTLILALISCFKYQILNRHLSPLNISRQYKFGFEEFSIILIYHKSFFLLGRVLIFKSRQNKVTSL